MKLHVNPLVIVTVIAALVWLHAQQPPRASRERVERTPKTPPDAPQSTMPSPWIRRVPFDPRRITLLENED